jgi:hypothetical protein
MNRTMKEGLNIKTKILMPHTMILMISDKKEEEVSTEAVDPDLNLTKIKIKQKTEM